LRSGTVRCAPPKGQQRAHGGRALTSPNSARRPAAPPDIRTQNLYEGRSINLALSERGLASLRKVGLADQVLSDGMPMVGRMIHSRDGSLHPLNYGLHGEYIVSVDRRKLNEALLSAAEAMPNVRIHFDHQLETMDFKAKSARFRRCAPATDAGKGSPAEAPDAGARSPLRWPRAHYRSDTKEVVEHQSDLYLGTDGAFSAVRKNLMKNVR